MANQRPPVTYTTFQPRDLGSDSATLFKTAAAEALAQFNPQTIIGAASCTAELIQDDPGGLAPSKPGKVRPAGWKKPTPSLAPKPSPSGLARPAISSPKLPG